MALDPNIYQNIDPNFGLKLGSIFDPAARQQREEGNRLANLASIGQEANLMQNLQQMKNAPVLAQRAEQEKLALQKQKYSQELDMFVANSIASGMPKEQVFQSAAQKAQQYGFNEDETRAGLEPLMTLQDPQQIHQHYLSSAMPEEAAKLNLQQMFAKPKAEDVLGEKKYRLAEKELEWKMRQKPATPLEPPPKAPPGTRVYQEDGEWKSEVIKGTPQWQMYKSKEAPDRALVQNIVPQFEKNVSDIDKLVNSKGFDKIFGLIAGQTPNITADAREAANLRAQVIGAMETSGMQLQRSAGGAVGSMTVQEWPKMQSYMNVIQNSNDPQAVKEALIGAQAVYDRMAEVAKEGYMNEWGSGQFGDPNVVARLSKQKPKNTPQEQPSTSYESDKEARYQAWKAQQGR